MHVPFCQHRCGYCDFTLVAGRDDLVPAYFEALQNELATLTQVYQVDSIFIGGGTPTHLPPDRLADLLEIVGTHFELTKASEFCVEANPDGLTKEYLLILKDHGVNRLSLGVQSFDDQILNCLERQHSGQEAVTTVERCADVFPNLSLDLIFGVPEQTIDVWKQTLLQALSLPIRHISTYGLTYERGTDFFSRARNGMLQPLNDSIERDMYALSMEMVTAAGLHQYEISNFAIPGFSCRHNQQYWNGNEYFAFGPGAARYINGIRSTNSRNVTRWINKWLRHEPALQDHEQLSLQERAREAIMLGLRQRQGISLEEFKVRFHVAIEELATEALRDNLQRGLLQVSSGRLMLTDEGIFVADSVMADFL